MTTTGEVMPASAAGVYATGCAIARAARAASTPATGSTGCGAGGAGSSRAARETQRDAASRRGERRSVVALAAEAGPLAGGPT